jgi:hypothetical protein
MVKDDTYENIVRYWNGYCDRSGWNGQPFERIRVPILNAIKFTPDYNLTIPIEPEPMNILTYTYTEESFPDCVVGMVECENVYVWCGIVEQRL